MLTAVTCFAVLACTKKGCESPVPNVDRLLALRASIQTGRSGQNGFLVIPNPIDATKINTATADDPRVIQAGFEVALPFLTRSPRLENAFVKIRIQTIDDDVSTLAKPSSTGAYNFSPVDVHYSETMAYYGVNQMLQYVEALGFSVVKTRPLYVMVRSKQTNGDDAPNALYNHNYLNPNSPRTIRLFGDSMFAPGMDVEMYRHEFGHLFNESVSREVGIDHAGDVGAIYTEGAALHECLADYLALSYGGKPNIGKWLARNFEGYSPGEPLRSMVDTGRVLLFRDVAFADGQGERPERYAVAEWCGRVLWEIRNAFLQDDNVTGPVRSDQLVFGALSRLKRDTSFSQFAQELMNADDALYCGGHTSIIQSAFANRGFSLTPSQLSQPVTLSTNVVAFDPVTGKVLSKLLPGAGVGFDIRIHNPNSVTARNVRLRLETQGKGLFITQYQQGYGDLSGGATLNIGNGGALAYKFSVRGNTDKTLPAGTKIPFALRLLVENGQGETQSGELTL